MSDDLKMLSNTEALGEEGTKKTLRGVFGLNMSTIIVAAICGILVATAIFEPTKTGASVYEIIINSVAIYVSTMAINSLLRDKAIRDAFAMPTVQEIIAAFYKRVQRVIDHDEMDDLDGWCDGKNAANYRNQRKRILAAAGLDYKDFFEDGEYTGKEIHVPRLREAREIGLLAFPKARRIAIRQAKALVAARYLRLSEISAQMLTSEGEDANDQYRMGRDVILYKEQTTKSQAVKKLVLAVVLGYYTAAVIANFSLLNLVLKIIQVAFALVMGAMDYLGATGYVVNELMGRYTKKTRIIDQYHGGKHKEGADSLNVNEVPCQLGPPDHESPGAGPKDRELHATASGNI